VWVCILKLNRTAVQILPLTPEDIPRLTHLQPDGWPPIEPYFKFYCSSSFCYPLKIVDSKGIVVAIGSCILHKNTGWVAHIIVDKNRRRQGLGEMMTASLMKLVYKSGRETVNLVATEMGAPLYQKLGFVHSSEYAFFKGGTRFESEAIPLQSAQAFETDILDLDHQATGEDRRQVLLPHIENGQVFIEEGRLAGFYLPTLGEGLIVATSQQAGIELMKHKLSQSWLYLAIPRQNLAATDFLQSLGFTEYRIGYRMVFGPDVPWVPEMIFGRIGGNLG